MAAPGNAKLAEAMIVERLRSLPHRDINYQLLSFGGTVAQAAAG